MAQVITHRWKGRPYQMEAFRSKARFVFMGAAWAVGKTTTMGPWLYQKCLETPDWPEDRFQGLLCANTYGQLIDSTVSNLFDWWRQNNIEFRPGNLPAAHKSFTIRLWVDGSWRKILCKALEREKSLHGTDVGFVAIDEAWGATRKAFDLAISRARYRYQQQFGGQCQALVCTTLDEKDSWMYEWAVTDLIKNPMLRYSSKSGRVYDEQGGLIPQRHIIYAKTEQNAKNLEDGYLAMMRGQLDSRSAARFLDAKWVSLSSGLIYTEFNRDIHVTELAEFDPSLPVYWSHDFNVGLDEQENPKPMSSCLIQFKERPKTYPELDSRGEFTGRQVPVIGKDGRPVMRKEAHIFDEIILETSNTYEVAEEIKQREYYHDVRKWYIHGDASGRKNSSSSKTTDYKILRKAGFTNHEYPKANPGIRDRTNTVSMSLRSDDGDIKLYVHPRCLTCIDGLESTQLKKGSVYKERETYSQHVTTAIGYCLHKKQPIAAGSGFHTSEGF